MMDRDQNKTKMTLKEFVNKRIFFRIPKEDKFYVRDAVMAADHHIFSRMLMIVLVLQLVMLAYKVVDVILDGHGFSPVDIVRVSAYGFLGLSCLISYYVSNRLWKKNKSTSYFAVVSVMVNVIYIWGLTMTVLDCTRGTELTTFSYTTMAVAAFVTLEPWVYIVNSISYSVALNLLVILIPDCKFYPSVIISSVSIAILIILIGTINFNRRIEIIMYEKEVNELNSMLHSNAYRDELTHINNRRYLTDHINEPMNIGDTPSAVIMLDIDDFKKVNDKFGHQNGDIVLDELGKILHNYSQKRGDSYGVRFGGEEFLIYIAHISEQELLRDAEKIRKDVAKKDIKLTNGMVINITISIGVASARVGQDYPTLINIADTNLYKAKSSGKNQIAY